jgi:hypothetical protein
MFGPIADDELALAHSPLLRAAQLTIDYMVANGPIGLTPSKALKRYFVQWAAEAFAWPHHTAADLLAINRVLNEQDFPPLVVLHDVLLGARLARHYRGALVPTKMGIGLKDRPAQLWQLLASHLLFEIDHGRYARASERPVGIWDIFLNIINVEAQAGVTEERLCHVLFGGEERDFARHGWQVAAGFYIHVLRPLCWTGLMDELRSRRGFDRQQLFVKTPLWPAALALETDASLRPVVRH